MEIDAAKAARVRLLALDVDGVLTDNGIWIGPVAGERVELKRFDIQDGLGLRLLRTAGIPVLWLSGRHSEATALRAEELRVDELLQVPGTGEARGAEHRCSRGAGSRGRRSRTSGDDLADLQVMRRVGLPDRGRQRRPRDPRGGRPRDQRRRAATAPCGRSWKRCSRRGESGPRCSSATSPSATKRDA